MQWDFDPEYSDPGDYLMADELRNLNHELQDWAKEEQFKPHQRMELPPFDAKELNWFAPLVGTDDFITPNLMRAWPEMYHNVLNAFLHKPESTRIKRYDQHAQTAMIAFLYRATQAQTRHQPERFNFADWVRGMQTCMDSAQQQLHRPDYTAGIVAVQGSFILFLAKSGLFPGLSFSVVRKMMVFEDATESKKSDGDGKIIQFPQH